MSEEMHKQARELLAKSLVEGISEAEESLLAKHLGECAVCAEEASATKELLRALRSVRVEVPQDLAARTQMRVRMRAEERAEQRGSGVMLWVLTAVSWGLGILMAPLVWRGFAWVGEELRVPKLALEMGFVLWWAIPALLALGVVLHQKAAGNGEKSWR